MRHVPSSTEALLWRLLRDRRLNGLKFRRQVVFGPYIVDFVCIKCRLVVEADGPFHDPGADAERDAWLDRKGLRVLRFTNAQIQDDRFTVLDAIENAALS